VSMIKTDEELVLLCRQKEVHAWETLVKRHQTRVLNMAYQFTSDSSQAEDLAQDVFVRLYESLDHYQEGRPFKTWFNSLARNLCIDHYRKRRKERSVVDKPVDEFHDLAADVESSDEEVERRERREMLLVALDRLGPVSREAIVLKDFQGMSHEEMADQAGVPIGTMKSRVSRARAELARIILKLEKSALERHPLPAGGTTHGMP
ncbi:MAG: sigma-70 family RNA polymerase sigma factor, partial [Candidatus Eisenbacteria bacterium]|nr:sigma-70 family RNA polymerase sigma factor [Candidatus Eisenbacteria bacterium]